MRLVVVPRPGVAGGSSTLGIRACISAAIALVALQAIPATAQPTIPFKSRELEEGKNFVQRLTTSLSVGESTGSLSTAYPIAIPAGRGVTPRIELQYSSSGGASEYGHGWELTIPMIERTTESGGAPLFLASDKYRFRNGHETAELEDTGTVVDGWSVYKERVEKSFNRFLLKDDSWRILTPSGLRYELGTSTSSRRVSPFFQITAAWLVKRIIDSHSNFAEYTYSPDPVGQARIASIQYNGTEVTGLSPGFRVDFTWTAGAFRRGFSWKPGYKRVYGFEHLSAITVTAPAHGTSANPAKIPASSPTTRQYSLVYASFGGEAVMHLISARLVGFPATQFEYVTSEPTGTIDTFVQFEPDDVSSFPPDLGRTETLNTVDGPVAKTRRVLADINSDGRPDILDTNISTGDPDATCTQFVAWINTGSGFTRTDFDAPAPELGGQPVDSCSLRNVRSGFISDTMQDFLDINGDGFPDVVYSAPGGIWFCAGTGSGFEPCRVYSGIAPHPFLRREETQSQFPVTKTDLIDFNGDGLVDLASVNGGTLSVNYNTGSGFAGATNSISPQCRPDLFINDCLRLTENAGEDRHLWTETKDINGDGIPDFIRTVFADPPSNELVVRARFGFVFAGMVQFEPEVALDTLPVLGRGKQAGGNYTSSQDLVDINADGLPDAVIFDSASATVSVLLNLGNGLWESSPTRTYSFAADPFSFFGPRLTRINEEAPPTGGVGATSIVAQLTDLNGDGNLDFVSAQLQPPLSAAILARQMPYRPTRKLVRATSLDSNVETNVTYAARNGTAPYPVHVVAASTRTRTALYAGEPVRNRSVTMQYTHSAMGFDRKFRQLTGFGSVLAMGDIFATHSLTTYATDYYQSGLVLGRVAENNEAAGALERTVNTYETVVLENPERKFTKLVQTLSNPGLMRTTITRHLDHDAFGLPTTTVAEGDPSTPSDDITQTRTYVTRETNSLVLHLPSTQGGSSVAGGPLPTTRYFYDGLGLGATPIEGDLTRVEKEKTAGVFIATTSAFDNEGNVVLEVDPMGSRATHTYDPTYHLFRVTTVQTDSDGVSRLGTNHRSFHALTGDVADSCGPQFRAPQGGTTTWRCSRTEIDVLGRVVAAHVPTYDGTAFGMAPLSTVTYEDNVYPLKTTLTKRGTSRTVEYRDGFGNPTELRVEETTNLFRVYETAYDGYARPLRTELPRRESGTQYAHVAGTPEATTYASDYLHGTLERVTHPREPTGGEAAFATRIVEADRVVSTDEDGRIAMHLLDHHNRVGAIELMGAGGQGPVARTEFTYSTLGQITSIKDPNNLVTSYGRNLLGWQTSVTAPDNGTTAYTHNDRGQAISWTDPRGVLITNTYDLAGRLTNVRSDNEPAGVPSVLGQIVYFTATTSAAGTTQFGYVKEETSNGILYGYSYNAEGAVTQHTVTDSNSTPNHTGAVGFNYEIGSRLSSITYPTGYAVSYSYNLDDSIAGISDGSPQALGSFLYDDDGQPSVVTNGYGLDESYTYDVRGRRTGIISSNTSLLGVNLVDDRIQLSKASFVERIDRNGLAPGSLVPRPSPDVYIIAPDYLGRVASVTLNGAHFGSYAYDVGGRHTTFNETAVPGTSASTFSADRLMQRTHGVEDRTFIYDAAGNVTRDDLRINGALTRRRNHDWDGLGRYARTGQEGNSAQYFYTPRSALAKVINPGAQPGSAVDLHIGQLARKNLTTGEWTNSIVANGIVIGEWTGPRFEMPHRTLLQTVAAVTNDLGQVVRQEEFKPFGSRSVGTGGSTFQQRFQGLRSDKLIVVGMRAYDSEAGIWLRHDPLLSSRPESVIASPGLGYSYGFDHQNPYKYRDSNGMWPFKDEISALNDIAFNALETTGDVVNGVSELLDPGYHAQQTAEHIVAGAQLLGSDNLKVDLDSPVGIPVFGGLLRVDIDVRNPEAVDAGVSHLGWAAAHAYMVVALVVITEGAGGGGGGRGGGRATYVPRGPDGRPLPLPRGANGELAPSSMNPHTQIGWKEGRRSGYVQTREFGPDGQPVKQVDWTNHGRPKEHTDPHVHDYVPNSTGGTPQHGPGRAPRPGEL